MRLSYPVCFCLLLVPLLAPAGPRPLADEPSAKKADGQAPDLASPTAKELADSGWCS